MTACAFTGGPAPWELIRSQMCETFHKLPSELDREDAGEMLRMWQILNTYQEVKSQRSVE